MGEYPTGPPPDKNYAVKSMHNAGFIIIFCYWGLVMVCLSSFLFFKRAYLRKRPGPPVYMNPTSQETEESKKAAFVPEEDLKTGNTDSHIGIQDPSSTRFQGYREHIWGRICYALCLLTSLHWVALLILVYYDYYNKCQVKGIDAWCYVGNWAIFGSYLNNGQVFFTVWLLNTIWFTTWIALLGRVRNMFRMQCDMSQATTIVVWEPLRCEILSANVMRPVLFFRRMKDRFSPPALRGSFTTVNVSRTKAGVRFFLHHGIRFLIKGAAISKGELIVGTKYTDFHEAAKGLTQHEAAVRLDDAGPNAIPFKPLSFFPLLSSEYLSFFYLYQWVFYQMWFWGSYLFPATIVSSIVILSGFCNMYFTHRGQKAIAKLSKYTTECDVLRDGEWIKIDSQKLVPGDVVRLRSDWLLPADLIIIQGSCVCNESALTGEAMPVQKYACPNEATVHDNHQGGRHMLFSGTTLLQAGNNKGDEVLGVVSATGMQTGKGELLSAILYPENMVFKYDEELVVVLILIFTYAGVCAILSVVIQVTKGNQTVWVGKWYYMVFIISQILSPILPVALNVGQMNAMKRLKKKGINCLNAKRIAISGKIRVFCFDKTGTLTRDGLDFLGVRPCANSELGPMITEPNSMPSHVLDSLASCHAVSTYGEGYVGNQVEVKMFEATQWSLQEAHGQPTEVVHPTGSRRLTIIKKNEFDHARATMSVIVRDQDNNYFVFCKASQQNIFADAMCGGISAEFTIWTGIYYIALIKLGSFEKIGHLCQPDSLPGNYMHEAQALALEGCYVLGISMKKLNVSRPEEALGMYRDQIEEGLSFIALMAFRNELKHDTRQAILAMKEGHVRPVMITGDNAQCGQYIAKACGMTAPECPIYLADVVDKSLVWKLSGSENVDAAPISSEQLMNKCVGDLREGRLELAMTGKAFRVLQNTSMMSEILFFCRIFARVTPEEKVQVCNLFRDAGLIVAMAGDGGNDCGALRAAHAGVALSDAEASVVSPFTSKSKSVVSCVDLLREGRGALHTSFGAVKFLMIYGLNFSVLKLTSYWYGLIVSPFMYLSIDAFAILTLGYAVTLSHPAKKLAKRRPTSSLIGPLQVASNLGYWLISVAYLIGALYLMQSDPDYVPWPTKLANGAQWWTLSDNWESTVVFFVLYFNYITASFTFTFGSEFRRPVFYNWVLMGFYTFLMVFYSWLLLSHENSATRYYHIASTQFNSPNPDPIQQPVWSVYQAQGGQPSPAMSQAFRFKFWGLCMANCLTGILWQKVVAEGVVSDWLRKKHPSERPVFKM